MEIGCTRDGWLKMGAMAFFARGLLGSWTVGEEGVVLLLY